MGPDQRPDLRRKNWRKCAGSGQYYNPATGRFLARQNQPANPYLPKGVDPIGAMVGPLALVGLLAGKDKKKKAGLVIMVLIVLLASGVAVAGCGTTNPTIQIPPSTTPAGNQSGPNPGGSPTNTPSSPGSPTSNPSPTETCTPTSGNPNNSGGSGSSGSNQGGQNTPTPEPTPPPPTNPQPIPPPGISPDNIVWKTYLALWENTSGWWWYKNNVKLSNFQPLDYLDDLLHFELQGVVGDTGVEVLEEVAVGNFCFWTGRNSDWSQGRPCVINDTNIFEYIDKRGLLKGYGIDIKTPNYSVWNRAQADLQYVPFREGFDNQDPRWEDWRDGGNWLNAYRKANDPLVEWGNSGSGDAKFDAEFVNIGAKDPGNKQGRETNQVGDNVGNWYALTFCQDVYYMYPVNSEILGIALNSHCGDPSHW